MPNIPYYRCQLYWHYHFYENSYSSLSPDDSSSLWLIGNGKATFFYPDSMVIYQSSLAAYDGDQISYAVLHSPSV